MYYIGSVLTNKLFSNFRSAHDIDFAVNKEMDVAEKAASILHLEGKYGKKVEIHYLPCHPDRELTKNELYTLKVSHATYNIHWRKTMSDIRFFQLNGCEIDRTFLKDLRDYWKEVRKEDKHKRTNFDVAFDDFFNDNVKRDCPHDQLHLAFNPNPVYKLIIEDGFVKPIEDRFLQLSDDLKDSAVLEEAFVIAVERFYKLDPYRTAYIKAQQALVTRLHPEFLADYVIENWFRLYTAPYNFYKRFEDWKK